MNIIKYKKYLIFFTAFILIIFLIFSIKNIFFSNQKNVVFSYPKGKIEFAGEVIKTTDLDLKQRFDKEFLNVSYNLYQFFLYAKRMPLYMDYIEEKLDEYNLPQDLKYLPIAESALRNDVVSTAGAAGIWQFIPDTATDYGLIVNDYVDERYNFEKATDAALRYLSYLYEKFDDWPLALSAYNRGQNAIAQALEDQNVDNFFDLYLNEETSRYFFRILAIKYVIIDYEKSKSNIDNLIGGVYEKQKTETINIGEIKNLQTWCEENGYIYKNIKELNPWILGDYLPDGEWELKVLK